MFGGAVEENSSGYLRTVYMKHCDKAVAKPNYNGQMSNIYRSHKRADKRNIRTSRRCINNALICGKKVDVLIQRFKFENPWQRDEHNDCWKKRFKKCKLAIETWKWEFWSDKKSRYTVVFVQCEYEVLPAVSHTKIFYFLQMRDEPVLRRGWVHLRRAWRREGPQIW